MVAIPLKKNKLIVRIENLADLLDQGAGNKEVKISNLLDAMYNASNPMLPNFTKTVKEMSLSANMELSELKKRKI